MPHSVMLWRVATRPVAIYCIDCTVQNHPVSLSIMIWLCYRLNDRPSYNEAMAAGCACRQLHYSSCRALTSNTWGEAQHLLKSVSLALVFIVLAGKDYSAAVQSSHSLRYARSEICNSSGCTICRLEVWLDIKPSLPVANQAMSCLTRFTQKCHQHHELLPDQHSSSSNYQIKP
jgi:hypothetical protein